MISDQQPVLDEEFWRGVWSAGDPPWRSRERRLAPYELFTTAALRAVADDPATAPDDPATALAGRRVIVPLCGDSPALKYFFDIGCDVTGIEFDAAVVRRAAAELFPGAAVVEESLADGGTSDGFLLRITRDPGTVAADGRLTADDRAKLSALPPATAAFYAADFYAVAAALAAAGNRFDVIYDRGSFVATAPAGRQRYAAAVGSVAAGPGDTALFGGRHGALHVMVHMWRLSEATRHRGPPFHSTRDAVLAPVFDRCKIVKVFDNGEIPGASEVYADVPFVENVSAMLWDL